MMKAPRQAFVRSLVKLQPDTLGLVTALLRELESGRPGSLASRPPGPDAGGSALCGTGLRRYGRLAGRR